MSKDLFLDMVEVLDDEDEEIDRRFKPTLCWDCKNSVPDGTHGCPWSERFQPVPGWKAEKTKFLQQYTLRGKVIRRNTDSYRVLECPMFIVEERRAENYKQKTLSDKYAVCNKRRNQLREFRTKNGLCSKCGRERKDKRYLQCEHCRKVARACSKKLYWERHQNGNCEEATNAQTD